MAIDNHLWLSPPTSLTLAPDEIHVWRAELDVPPAQRQPLQDVLTSDELERAARFRFEKDQRHYITARGILRMILGCYMNVPPDRLRFVYSDYGKPFLATEFDHHPLAFNLAHADGLALYAVTCNRHVGIDVERVRADFECEEVARRFFSPREVAVLQTIPTNLKPEAFFHCWTRKEAYIKAHGQGLSLPLDSFDVSFAPSESAKLLTIKGEPQEASHWTLQELMPGRGYVGALAVRGRNCKSKFWQWVTGESLLRLGR